MTKKTQVRGGVEMDDWTQERVVAVYLTDSRVFEYRVPDAIKAREFAIKMGTTGLRALYYDGKDNLVWEFYGPHLIEKIKVEPAIASNYTGKFRGT